MTTSGGEDPSADYRIDAVVNKVRAGCDRSDALAEELRAYKHGVTPHIFSAISQDPDFFSFLFRSRLLTPIHFLYYLAVDIGRLYRRVIPRTPPRRDVVQEKVRGSQQVAAAPHAPRILVDITGARTGRVGGGIKRVCDRLCLALGTTGGAQTCGIRDGKLYKSDAHAITDEELRFQPNDIYLMLDSFWDPFDEFVEVSKRARAAGATSVLCIHDIFPISRPKLVVDFFHRLFTQSCLALLPHVDGVISVSRASASEVEASLRRLGFDLPVAWFSLGCDAFDVANHWVAGTVPSFLSIGTLEPKKGYDVALDAFERLWADGIDATYTIVGKKGWLCDALVARIEHHPDFGKRLFWHPAAPDQDLSRLVGQSFCLVQASLAEGFGLPVAEAGASGLPVIASDLPVFREICAENVVFFPVCDSAALATAIRQSIVERPLPPKLNVHSWDAAAAALVDALNGIGSQRVSVQTS